MTRTFVIGGVHAVSTALVQANVNCVEFWVKKGLRTAQLEDLCAKAVETGLTVQEVGAPTLDRLVGSSAHQGVALRRRLPQPWDYPRLEQCVVEQPNCLLLILDRVQDPHNLGACLRVADGAGVDAVVTPRDHSVGLTSVVAKTASGALDTVPLAQVGNLAQTLQRLAQHGVWCVGATHDGTQSIYDCDLSSALALVLGGEGRGLRRLTRQRCDHLIRIPMHGVGTSLNVSTAAAVCLFEARRQRSIGAG